MTDAAPDAFSLRARVIFTVLAVVFFAVTATTFAALGLVLPAMIAEFGWSWAEAGLGFTVLALFTGLFSPVSSPTLKRLGAPASYAIGGATTTAGFLFLASLSSLPAYLVATALIGAGFALLANVPSVYVIARTTPPARRGFLIGLYLAAGGLGGVAGPLAAGALLGSGADWRWFWAGAAATIAALSALLVAALVGARLSKQDDEDASAAPSSARDWTLGEAIRTPAFFAVSGALLAAYLCGVSVSSFAATQLQALGHSATAAGAIMSLHAAANAGARALGGVLVRRLSASTLLVSALVAEIIGMVALAFAGPPAVAVLFALAEGYAFGMALFATTLVAIERFGVRHSPAILGAMNLVATAAMVGPVLTGAAGDATGGFGGVFLIYAALSAAAMIGVLAISWPREVGAAPQD